MAQKYPFNLEDLGIREETGGGLRISDKGWQTGEMFSVDDYLLRFTTFDRSMGALEQMIRGGGTSNSSESKEEITVISKVKEDGFGSDGTLKTKKFTCPECGKRVDKLLKNGYCSKGCHTKAKLAAAQKSVSNAGEKSLEVLAQIQDKLRLLDAVLNLITELPELIRDKAKLPQEFRDYITLRIDEMFFRLKYIVNLLMIQKNDLVIELLKKVKFGALDKVLESAFAPIKTVMTTIAGIQQTLVAALTALDQLMSLPVNGPVPPESMGWFLTAKSVQYPKYGPTQICIPVIPEVNKALPKLSGNMIDYQKIDALVKKVMPPIQEFEYFIDPAAFKIRYALSQDNGIRVKKAWEMLEAIMKMGAEIMPRYKDLKLTNPFYVLAILTSWGPQSREVYGDFIFHASM